MSCYKSFDKTSEYKYRYSTDNNLHSPFRTMTKRYDTRIRAREQPAVTHRQPCRSCNNQCRNLKRSMKENGKKRFIQETMLGEECLKASQHHTVLEYQKTRGDTGKYTRNKFQE